MSDLNQVQPKAHGALQVIRIGEVGRHGELGRDEQRWTNAFAECFSCFKEPDLPLVGFEGNPVLSSARGLVRPSHLPICARLPTSSFARFVAYRYASNATPSSSHEPSLTMAIVNRVFEAI